MELRQLVIYNYAHCSLLKLKVLFRQWLFPLVTPCWGTENHRIK